MSNMDKALRYCATEGLLRQLSEKMIGALPDIIGQYKLYVYAVPWKRYPAMVLLKQICTTLTVRISHHVDITSH